MSVRKRTWTTKGVERTGWQADYLDAAGKRHRKMFERKKDADAFLVTARGEVREGTHVADADSATVGSGKPASYGWRRGSAPAASARQSINTASTSIFISSLSSATRA